MKNIHKYGKQYFTPKNPPMSWTKRDFIEKAPIWCSVDLRDGNQALVIPMGLKEKLDFFQLLCEIGFKEIEVGVPAASETEYEFCRALIERALIPDDVTIQVLTPSRKHIIEKTFEALEGAKKAIVHLYNSTSIAQREQVFKREKQEIIDIAVEGAKLCLQYKKKAKGEIFFEYSPESFTATEPEFAAQICNAVLDVWQPTAQEKVIINLPVTVAYSMPHVYANQVEYISNHLRYRENVILSLHPHNDRGCAVADTEMGLLAGGQRVEGTLFGNGERSGNVDIVTLALNMYSQGVEPNLDFSNLPKITEVYEKVTGMRVGERQPYSGQLVFAAFSGSHQDAIAKGMKYRAENELDRWTVPYLLIDPKDVGREYDADVIRINSLSGKGGIGYVLESQFRLSLPSKMREVFGYHIKNISDHAHKELHAEEIHDIFLRDFVNLENIVRVGETVFEENTSEYGKVEGVAWGKISITYKGEKSVVRAEGNGRLDCVCNALREFLKKPFTLESYTEHAISEKSNAKAASYVSIVLDGKTYWGAGIHSDIMRSSVKALVSAVNKLEGLE